MSEKIFILGLVGAAIGAAAGGVASVLDHRKKQKSAFPYFWPYIECDPGAMMCMKELELYRVADESCFQTIGHAMNQIIELQCLIQAEIRSYHKNQPNNDVSNAPTQIMYAFEAFRHRNILDYTLLEWHGKIKEYNGRVQQESLSDPYYNPYDIVAQSIEKDKPKILNEVRYIQLCDQASQIMFSYYWNITLDETALVSSRCAYHAHMPEITNPNQRQPPTVDSVSRNHRSQSSSLNTTKQTPKKGLLQRLFSG